MWIQKSDSLGTEEMVQSAKSLSCKHENADLQHPGRKSSAAESPCNPSDSAGRWVGYQRASWSSLTALLNQANELPNQ